MLAEPPVICFRAGKPCAVDPALLSSAYADSLTSADIADGIRLGVFESDERDEQVANGVFRQDVVFRDDVSEYAWVDRQSVAALLESDAIDLYISDDHDDVLRDDAWQDLFTSKPDVFTRDERSEWIAGASGVSLGSDAFFPFGDNIERARKSGVMYIAQPGGSIRDEDVIETCDKHGIVMAFTGIRLFHH